MTSTDMAPEDVLGAIADSSSPVFDAIFQIHLDTLASSTLDERSYHLVRLAALVASGAPPASYLLHVPMAVNAGVTLEDAQGLCMAIAPIVGTPKVTEAAGNVLRALDMAEAIDES
jgi:4-carboxymuconolactone decarboxylase